jgi:carbon-monoxide dehydrogenase medium subunit
VKPAAFEYHDPSSVEEVMDLLRRLGDEAKLLAGGQSLVPAMNFRLARPAHLIDLNGVAELAFVRVDDDGSGASAGGARARRRGPRQADEPAGRCLRIGAMARQRAVERSQLVLGGWPLLSEAMRHVGHLAIRTRGTIGGSLAHADPAAELPAVMCALDAELVIRGGPRARPSDAKAIGNGASARTLTAGENGASARTVTAGEFFVGYLTTVLAPDELLTEIRVPPMPLGTGWSFQEVSRRWGDFALVGVAAVLRVVDGRVAHARLAFTGVGATPVRALQVEAALIGQPPSDAVFRAAAQQAAAHLQPDSDLHASALYRREVAAVLAERALSTAAVKGVTG